MQQQLAQLNSTLAAMPPVAALGIAALEYTDHQLTLGAPLAANINDKGNAFGGSLASILTLSGWGLVSLELAAAGLQADVYVADSRVRYLAPLYGDLAAAAQVAADADWGCSCSALPSVAMPASSWRPRYWPMAARPPP